MFVLYSVKPSQEIYSKGHRAAAHGPHPACLHSCIIWSTTQHNKNQEILKLQCLKKITKPGQYHLSTAGWN